MADTASRAERSPLEAAQHYLALINSRKWLIILVAAYTSIAAVAFSLLTIRLPPEKSPLPNRYRAYARLLVRGDQDSSLASLLSAMGITAGSSGGTSANPGALALEVLGSRAFVDNLVHDFDLDKRFAGQNAVVSKSRSLVRSNASYVYERNTGILTVVYEETDPVLARDMVNRIVERLNEWFLSTGATTSQRQRSLLEGKMTEVSADLIRLESEIADLQRRHGVLDVEDLVAKQTELLADLRSRSVLKEMEIRSYTARARIEDPQLRQLRIEQNNLQELIQQVEQGRAGLSPDMPGREDLPDLALKFRNTNEELEIQRAIWRSLSQQYEIVKLDLASDPTFQVMELAEIPDRKSGPSRSKLCIAAVMLAIAGTLGLLIAQDSVLRATKGKAGQ